MQCSAHGAGGRLLAIYIQCAGPQRAAGTRAQRALSSGAAERYSGAARRQKNQDMRSGTTKRWRRTVARGRSGPIPYAIYGIKPNSIRCHTGVPGGPPRGHVRLDEFAVPLNLSLYGKSVYALVTRRHIYGGWGAAAHGRHGQTPPPMCCTAHLLVMWRGCAGGASQAAVQRDASSWRRAIII